MPAARRPPTVPRGAVLGVVVAAVQALALVVAAVGVLVELVSGRSDSVARAVSEAVLALVVAAGLAALAVAWRRAPDRARTPALVWHVLLVPVVISLFQSAQPALGVALGVVTGLGLLGAALGGGGSPGSSTPTGDGSQTDPDGEPGHRRDEPEQH